MNDTPPKPVEGAPPDLCGTQGKAWMQDIAAAMDRIDRRGHTGHRATARPPPDLAVASWIAWAPYAHPLWPYYWIGCISLREIEGCPAARIHLDGATHEVMVYALNPSVPPAIDDAPRLLQPANFHGQFIEPNDAAAAERIRVTVQDVIDGKLNPDTDYMRLWIQRFGDSNLNVPR